MSFKIYVVFESVLEGVKRNDTGVKASHTKKNQKHILWSFSYKVVSIYDRFSKQVVLYRGKNAVNKFITAIPNEYMYCKLMMKNSLIKIWP